MYHLAQINIATALAPLDDPIMADFMNNLAPINALAEQHPGYVWRLQTPAGDATSILVFDDHRIIINMSVWESVEALFQFTYYSDHAAFYRRRGEWFEKMSTPVTALWWVPAGTTPTPEDGKAKIEYLEQCGPTPFAFTFKQRFTVEEMLAYQQKE